jgi:WD40 repeat protein
VKLTKIATLAETVYAGSRIGFDPIKKAFVYGSHVPGQIGFWSVETGKELPSVTLETELISCIAFSRTQPVFATANTAHQIKLWDVVTRKHVNTLEAHKTTIRNLLFCPTQPVLASSSFHDDKTLLWDTHSGKIIAALEFGAVAFSPDGKNLVISGDNGIHFYESQTGRRVNTLTTQPRSDVDVAYQSDGRYLAAIKSDEHSEEDIEIWDMRTKKPVAVLSDPKIRKATVFAFCPQTDILVSGHIDEMSASFWNINQQKLIYEPSSTFDRLLSIVFNPDGEYVAFGACSDKIQQEKKIEIWRLSDIQEQNTITEQSPS